ncbi:MAG: 3'-5' exonuclease [Bacilli bacterium]|nr:3'-5' exonuclease [Bacilli bacterium]
MKYVFFDIECANYVNDMFTICTFGYTIVDSNFNVIKKEDILINPHSKFNKIVLNKIIHYKEEDFLDKPSFAEIYPFIKELLTNKDHMCFGFDVGNDLRFLNGEYKRYDLEPINVKAYDIQHIHKLIKQLKTPESLSKAAMSMDIDFDSIELHNSKDDAYLTMLVAKELEKISDTPLHQLINLSNHIAIDSNNIVNPNKARSNELKLLISKYPERNKAFSFCLSEELEAKDKENDYVLIKSILDAGYSYTTRVNASRVYVSDTETDPRDETYLKRIEKHPDKTKKISKKQLLSMIKNKPSVKV